jgi:hypothetical protein
MKIYKEVTKIKLRQTEAPQKATPIGIVRFLYTVFSTILQQTNLDVGRIEHDPNSSTKSLGRKVLLEVCSDNTRISMRSSDLSPDNSDFGSSDFLAGTVHKGHSLSEVELSFLRRRNALYTVRTC